MEMQLAPRLSSKPSLAKSRLKETSKNFDYNLEALRGFAAFFVVLFHIILFKKLDPDYTADKITAIITPGHLSVLIFFVLSGYVIGITNKQRFTGDKIFPYLKKRFIRLYPIYAISVLFALTVATTKYPFSTIVNNFIFTQVLFSEVISEINPIWSLNYEVLYYLLFIPISFFSINPIVVVFISLIIGAVNFIWYPQINAPLITSYTFGLAFWAMGLVIAKYFSKNIIRINFTLLLSNIFLILCLSTVNPFPKVFYKISTVLLAHSFTYPDSVNTFERIITFLDLSFLPFCLMSVLIFSGKEFRFKKQIFGLLQLLPVIKIVYMFQNKGEYGDTIFLVHWIYYLLSTILFFTKAEWIDQFAKRIIKAGSWLGSISYGLYIIHYPLLVLFSRIDYFSGTALSYATRLILFIIVTFYASYLLERKLQPWVKSKVLTR